MAQKKLEGKKRIDAREEKINHKYLKTDLKIMIILMACQS